jgi:integrase
MPRTKKKAQKRINGEGSVYWDDKRKRYIGAISVGTDPKTGKPIRRRVSDIMQQTALDKMHELEIKYSLGARLDVEKVTVGEWLDRWMTEYMDEKLRDTVYPSYARNIRLHAKPYIGKILLKSLQTDDLQQLFRELLKSGRDDKQKNKKEKPGLSRRSVEYIRAILREALNKAVVTKLIIANPVIGTELPPKVEVPVVSYTKKEVERFLNSITKHRLLAAYYLAFYTGLRMGEILGLMWKDIDFMADSFEVIRELVCVTEDDTSKKQHLEFQPPKSKKSVRIIPIVEELVKVLKSHRAKQNEEKLFFGQKYHNEDLVFCGKDGKRIWPRNFDTQYHKLVKKSGVDPKKFHTTRHTFASRLFEQGEDVRSVQELLGHAQMATTGNTYIHIIEETKRRSLERLKGMYDVITEDETDSEGNARAT